MVDVALSMHINHRRKNPAPTLKKGRWLGIYSMKPMRQEFWRRRRAQDRTLMAHGRYDLIPVRHPNSIEWDYW